MMTFKEYLKEMEDINTASDMTPAEYARYKKQKQLNPKRAAMQNAKKQDLESRAAAADDTASPDVKKAERLEAQAARHRMRIANQQKQNEAQ